jgi:HK97 family phage prohead protease
MPYFITDDAYGCSGWATIKNDGEVLGCHKTKQAAIDQMVALSMAEDIEPGGERSYHGGTPAPKKDQIKGSKKNPEGSASGSGNSIKLSARTETTLKNKADEHNEKMRERNRPEWTRVRLGALKAVYRRGAGAYSTSHRPGISRSAWAFARVNAFLFLARTGRPQRKTYVQDNDLLHPDHPRRTKRDLRAVSVPEYVQEAAKRGLKLYREGKGGKGLTEGTLREARAMARGQMSDDKVIRANAWAARHKVDLQRPKNNDPDNREWPGPGAVAHYLWGIDPLNPEPARKWLSKQAEKIKGERGQMSTVEMRQVQVQDLELREESGGRSFSGYAAVFNSDSEPLPFIEQIRPGAFERTLSSRNQIKMFVNHEDTMVLASTRAGTLRLKEDSRGLRVDADLPETSYAKDLAVLMKRGDVDSMSFGFHVPAGTDEWSSDGQRRYLNEIALREVSIVTGFPAYEATSATIRKATLLAQRTETDAELLAEALTVLEAGETLDSNQADLLIQVVQRQSDQPEPEPQEADETVGLLRDKLELIAKTF